MQSRPVCFGCDDVVEYDPIYEAPCGHEKCSSAVWHGLCLMEWREHREAFIARFRKRMEQFAAEHGFILEEDE